MTQPPAPPFTAGGTVASPGYGPMPPHPGPRPFPGPAAPNQGPTPGFGPPPAPPQAPPYGPPPGWAPAPQAVSRTTTWAGVLQVVAIVLVPLGAGLPFGESFGSGALWAVSTTWAAFATLAALIASAPLMGRSTGRPAEPGWKVGAVAVAALIGFWVLIVLPGISSGQNFVITLGVFAAAGGLWLSPGRQL